MTGKIGLSHTEFCTRQVHGPQIVQTFSLGVKPQTEKVLVLDEHSHIEYMDYLKKTVHVSSTFRDCSLFIGSTGPVFCGKDPCKKFLSCQQKFPKKLVSHQWKEGKKSMSRIITLYSHCVRAVICNDQRSLPLTAGDLGVL